jgi:RsiW-degrading membrane proteinase PrsW (M82 family)
MKLKLEVQSGSLTGQRFEMQNGWVMVGRGEDCPMRFASDPVVSSRHAILHALPDGFHLIDQRSTNGTFVNGQRITDAILRSGDVIHLGANGPQLFVTIEPEIPAPQFQPPSSPAIQPQNSPQAVPQPVAASVAVPMQAAAPLIISQPATQFPQHPPMSGASSSQPALGQPALGQPALGQPALGQAISNIGTYQPEKDHGHQTNSLWTILALISGAVLALLTIGITTLELGIISAIVCSIIAFIPALHYLFILLWLDRYDPEPGWLLASAFAWGALLATFVSSIINTIAGSVGGDTFGAVISAPIIEEATKGLGVILIALLFRREFDSIADGIVYAGVIALGFATVENVSYYGRALNEAGGAGLVGTFFGRGILSPFAHVLFTGMTGIAVGMARETHDQLKRFGIPVIGYICAVILHAFWNGIAVFTGRGFLIVYALIEVPLFLLFVGGAIWMTRREGRILRQTLEIEVGRGLLPAEHLQIVSSIFNRLRWVLSVISNRELFGARRRYLRAVTKLGFCHWHATRAVMADTQTQSFSMIPRLQAEVFSLRDQVG